MAALAVAERQSSCTCQSCVRACERNPGWMTPDEATAAMKAGHAARLMRDFWEPDSDLGNEDRIHILAPASLGYESADAPDMPFLGWLTDWHKGRCTFLKNRRCEIHNSGFKPIQCRLALVCDPQPGAGNIELARMWNTDEGRAVIAHWQHQTGAMG